MFKVRVKKWETENRVGINVDMLCKENIPEDEKEAFWKIVEDLGLEANYVYELVGKKDGWFASGCIISREKK